MKECPHCHEDTFGTRELFTLDYFHTDECKNCGKSVRNDGLRQLLVLPAVLAAVAPTILIMSVIPEVLEPFAFLLILILIALPMILLPRPVKAEADVTLSPFTPNLRNDKVIMVSGWNEGEIRTILDGFIAEGDTGLPACRIELQKQYENHFRLTFPEDIHPSLFASLVNYLMYPIEFDTRDHPLTVVGKMTLDPAFPGTPESLIGQKALLYVPENDQEYDTVYMQTESGINLANSFAEETWRPIDEAKMPAEVKRLSLKA